MLKEFDTLILKAQLKYYFKEYEKAKLITEEALDLAITDKEIETVFSLAKDIQAESDSTLLNIMATEVFSGKELKQTVATIMKREMAKLEDDLIFNLAEVQKECDYNLCIVDLPKKEDKQLKFHGIKKTRFEETDFFLSKHTVYNKKEFSKTAANGWNSLVKLNYPIKEGVWIFTLQVKNIHYDKSGLAFGFNTSDSFDHTYEGILYKVNGYGNSQLELHKNDLVYCIADYEHSCIQFFFNEVKVASYTMDKLEGKPCSLVILNYYSDNKVELKEVDTTIGSQRVRCDVGHLVYKAEAYPYNYNNYGIFCNLCKGSILQNRDDLLKNPSFFWFRCKYNCNYDVCKQCYLEAYNCERFHNSPADSDFMEQVEQVDKTRWNLIGDATMNKYNEIARTTDYSTEWNDLWTYDSQINCGIWEFELKIISLNAERQGIHFGFIEDKDYSDYTKYEFYDKSVGIDGMGKVINHFGKENTAVDYESESEDSNEGKVQSVQLRKDTVLLFKFDFKGQKVTITSSNQGEVSTPVVLDIFTNFRVFKFAIFNQRFSNKVEVLAVRNNLIKDYPLEDYEFLLQNTSMVDGKIVNTNESNDWDHYTRFERILDKGVWRFRFEILSLNGDASGLVIGLVNAENTESSLEFINSKVLGINISLDRHMKKLGYYKVEKGQILEVRVDATKEITFFLDDVPVLKSNNFQILEPNRTKVCLAIFNYYSNNEIKLLDIKTTDNSVFREKLIPDQPLLFNSMGETLERCSQFPNFYGEFGYIFCDSCKEYIGSKCFIKSSEEFYWYRSNSNTQEDYCANCIQMKLDSYKNKVEATTKLKFLFLGFGRIENNIIYKKGENAWDSLVYSEVIDINYVRLNCKIKKLNSKDPSGLTLGIMDANHIHYDKNSLENHSIAINGKGFRYKYNIIENQNFLFKENDRVIMLYNQHRKIVEYYLNGMLIAYNYIDLTKKYVIFFRIYHTNIEVEIVGWKIK